MKKDDEKKKRNALELALEALGLTETEEDLKKQAKKSETVVSQKVDRQGNPIK